MTSVLSHYISRIVESGHESKTSRSTISIRAHQTWEHKWCFIFFNKDEGKWQQWHARTRARTLRCVIPRLGSKILKRIFRRRCVEIYRRARNASYCKRRIRERQQRIGT